MVEVAPRPTWRALALLLVFLVLVRGFLVLSCAEVFFYGEELAKGGAAKAILDSPPIPYHQLVYAYHEGGGFVIAHARALSFLLVGESLLATKLVAIATSALVLVVGVTFARESFGRRASIVFGVLFVLCPDAWLRFSLLSIGTHFEALFFECAILLLAFRILRSAPGRARDWILLGLASGFGIYFSLVIAAAIAAAGAMLLVGLRARILGRGLALATAAAIVGASPLLWMLGRVGIDALRVRGQSLAGGERSGPIGTLGDLFAPLVANGRVDDWLQFAILGSAALSSAWILRERGSRLAALWILGFLGVYFALYLGSGLATSMNGLWLLWWRMSPTWFFATLLAAAVIDALLTRRRAVAGALIAVLVAAGLMDVVRLARTGRPDLIPANAAFLARAKGYDFAEYFDQIVHHLDGDERERIRVLLALRDDTHLLPSAIAHNVFEESELPFERVLDISRAEFGQRFDDALLGLGHHLHPRPGYDIPAAFERLAESPADLRTQLARALGRTGLGQRFRRDRLVEQIETPLPPEFRDAFLEGVGWRIWRAYLLDPAGGLAFVESRPVEERAALMRGLALERAAWTLP